ncbi:hypothetical protein H4N49_36575 [Streptomyces sp. DHE17-7]|nr:hypothetical protein [Streptomyces sp. DHE17-7]RIH58369.1 hypothetical protein D3C59_35600 [Streptomyces sp. SHP22-7]RIH58558.1 hypothetical protein D3C59_34260 [Streptomyces sp. SHP22-7]RIH58665.1 hypothetical protein D3C59_33530 [Streptomyces sp. SHP22-7]
MRTPTMPKKPSQPWRLVLTTPSVPVYTKHRSKPAAYRAVQEEKERIAAELSNVVRIAVDQWDVDGQRWVRYENVWDKTTERLAADRATEK